MIIWRLPRKIRLTPETTEARIVCYAIIQAFRLYLGLTHSSLEASIYLYTQNLLKPKLVFYSNDNEMMIFTKTS